jgi:hypothetical protein
LVVSRLAFLIDGHPLNQKDLPEIGPQSVVSETRVDRQPRRPLANPRRINIRLSHFFRDSSWIEAYMAQFLSL